MEMYLFLITLFIRDTFTCFGPSRSGMNVFHKCRINLNYIQFAARTIYVRPLSRNYESENNYNINNNYNNNRNINNSNYAKPSDIPFPKSPLPLPQTSYQNTPPPYNNINNQ